VRRRSILPGFCPPPASRARRSSVLPSDAWTRQHARRRVPRDRHHGVIVVAGGDHPAQSRVGACGASRRRSCRRRRRRSVIRADPAVAHSCTFLHCSQMTSLLSEVTAPLQSPASCWVRSTSHSYCAT
jgi:hypothetical protein